MGLLWEPISHSPIIHFERIIYRSLRLRTKNPNPLWPDPNRMWTLHIFIPQNGHLKCHLLPFFPTIPHMNENCFRDNFGKRKQLCSTVDSCIAEVGLTLWALPCEIYIPYWLYGRTWCLWTDCRLCRHWQISHRNLPTTSCSHDCAHFGRGTPAWFCKSF